jgi:hypothetical protein
VNLTATTEWSRARGAMRLALLISLPCCCAGDTAEEPAGPGEPRALHPESNPGKATQDLKRIPAVRRRTDGRTSEAAFGLVRRGRNPPDTSWGVPNVRVDFAVWDDGIAVIGTGRLNGPPYVYFRIPVEDITAIQSELRRAIEADPEPDYEPGPGSTFSSIVFVGNGPTQVNKVTAATHRAGRSGETTELWMTAKRARERIRAFPVIDSSLAPPSVVWLLRNSE